MKVKKKTKINFFKKAKVNKIIFKFLYVVLIINLLYSVIFLINTTITKRKYLHVFNISFFVMKDNSMKGDISKNDLIIVKDIKKDLNVNDIIVYNLKGKIKVNKVINIQMSFWWALPAQRRTNGAAWPNNCALCRPSSWNWCAVSSNGQPSRTH